MSGDTTAVATRPSEPPPPAPRRRRPSPLTAIAVLAAAVVVGFGIGAPLLGIGTFSGADLLRSYEPWRSGVDTGDPAQLPVVSDTVDVVLPGHALFDREVRRGHVPDWNPLVSGGTAFADGTGVGFWSPLSLPYLLLPGWLAPAYVKLLEMLVAIGGSVLFLRRLSLSRPAAVLGGIVFASSGFMVTWSNWPHTAVAAFIPALFWAVERFAQRRTVPAAVPIAVVLAAMLAGGFPAVVGYALYAAAPYLLLRLAQLTGRRPWAVLRGAATAGGALVLGAGAVAVLLLPFLGQLRQLDYLAERAQTPAEHLPAAMLFTTAVWRAFGTQQGDDAVPYWGPINVVEGLSFVGAGALVLVLLALLRPSGAPRGVRSYFAVAAAVSIVLGYAGGPALALAQHLPVFSDNPVYRIRSVLGFFLAVLAAIGYDALARSARPRRVLTVAGWLVAAVVGYVAAKHLLRLGYEAGQGPYVKRQILLALLPAALVLGAAVLARRFRTVALAVIPVVVAVECLSLLVPFWPRTSRADFYPVTGVHRYLAGHLGTDRFGAKGLTLLSGTNVWYGLRNVTGHAFTSPQWRDLLLAVDPDAFPTPGYSRFSGATGAATMASPLLDVLSVRYFAFAPNDPVIGPRTTVGPAGPGLRLRPGVPVTVPAGSGPVRGVGPRVLVAAHPADPRAELDVQLLDAGGRVVAAGSRRLYGTVAAARLVVPVAGEDLTGPLSARLTLRSDAPLEVAGGALPQLDVTRPAAADGLDLVYAGDGAVLYRRDTALPRFRWASRAVVVTDPAARRRLLAHTREPDRVVLSGPGPAGSGRPGSVDVLADGTDGSTTRVTAAGAGYLVVGDADQAYWTATVDGRAVPLVPADHALVAVPVPAGTHTVTLAYRPPGQRLGAGISLLSVSVLV
ncbi:MAG TPA: YfhO family protein, partial [Mycobacteriales bacterium]|nr:YfhO family protein [Mycobacteriales bacterium]